MNKAPFLALAATLMTLALGILAWYHRRRILAAYAMPLILLTCMYVYLLMSYLASNQPISAFGDYQFLKEDGNFFFAYALFFAYASPYISHRKLFTVYHNLLFYVFSAFALLGAIEMATGITGVLSNYYMGEFYFSVLNKSHNATGSVYAAASVATLSAWLFDSKSPKKRRRYLFFLSCCLLGLMMTRSRGSLLAFGIAAVFLYRTRYGLRFFASWRFIVLVVLLTAVILATGAQRRFSTLASYQTDYNTMDRLVKWEKAWHLFKLSPIVGIGFGRFNDLDFREAFGDCVQGYPGIAAFCIDATPVYDSGHAHNSYLQFLAETGLAGLGLLLTFWYSLYMRLRRAFADSNDDMVTLASVQGMAEIVLLLSLSLTENYLSATTVMLFMSASIGISLGIVGRSTRKSQMLFIAGNRQAGV